jgi:5'(3')-deoxyribonucleotidase
MNHIIVDLDNCLAASDEHLVEFLKVNKGIKNPKHTLDGRWWFEGEDVCEAIRDVFTYPDFFYSIKPIPGAIEGFNWLMEMSSIAGIVVLIVSSPPIDNKGCWVGVDQKSRWVSKHLPEFPMNNLIITSSKGLLLHNCCAIIEDDYKFLERVCETDEYHRQDMDLLCIEKPWNSQVVGKRMSIAKVSDWDKIIEYFKN